MLLPGQRIKIFHTYLGCVPPHRGGNNMQGGGIRDMWCIGKGRDREKWGEKKWKGRKCTDILFFCNTGALQSQLEELENAYSTLGCGQWQGVYVEYDWVDLKYKWFFLSYSYVQTEKVLTTCK